MNDEQKSILIGVILTIVLSVLVTCAFGDDYPRDDSAHLVQWSKARKDVDYGHGPIVDDIESYVLDNRFSRQMRDKNDIGNWVHEQTHYVNARFRITMKKRSKIHGWNSAYVLNGYAFSALEPSITLADVAVAVPEAKKGRFYKQALIEPQNDPRGERNSQPLYVLDEASAAANALCYQVSVKKMDATRCSLALEWADYSDALVVAVEKDDSEYESLNKLRWFVTWHNVRIRFLSQAHRNLDPRRPPPKPYKLY